VKEMEGRCPSLIAGSVKMEDVVDENNILEKEE
jgi:hypothetical protein